LKNCFEKEQFVSRKRRDHTFQEEIYTEEFVSGERKNNDEVKGETRFTEAKGGESPVKVILSY